MLRSLGGATERSLGARRLLTSGSLLLPPDLRPSFLLQLEPLLPGKQETEETKVGVVQVQISGWLHFRV